LLNKAESIAMTAVPQQAATGLVCGRFDHQHPLVDRLLKQLPDVVVIRQRPQSASAAIVKMLLQESMRSGQQSGLLLNRLSDCLFLMIVRDHVDVDSGVFAGLTHPRLASVMNLIHGEPSQSIHLDRLANEASMSRSAFSALFKSVIGQSPMDYLKQWRITLAYRWLVDEGVTTYEAALRCGYDSESSFSKAFQSVMGFGPGKARALSKATK
jgi:transcriptional regulator GlxA family with amidase domain